MRKDFINEIIKFRKDLGYPPKDFSKSNHNEIIHEYNVLKEINKRTKISPYSFLYSGGGGATSGDVFALSMLGTVPRWDGTFYGVSGANLGISGASAFSVQALVSLDATTNAFKMICQIGNDTADLGAFIGALNFPSAGGYALGAHYYTTPFGTHYYTTPFGTQSRINPVAAQWYHLTATYDGTTFDADNVHPNATGYAYAGGLIIPAIEAT